MAEIISFDKSMKRVRKGTATEDRKRKINAVIQVCGGPFHNGRCRRCGLPSASSPAKTGTSIRQIPYEFCESCREEYIDFIERLKGGGDPACWWRNDAWLDVWQTWIAYQGARDRYRGTKVFKQLVEELKQPDPPDRTR